VATISFKQFPTLLVRRESAARRALERICETGGAKEGTIFFVSEEEFLSLLQDVIAITSNETVEVHG